MILSSLLVSLIFLGSCQYEGTGKYIPESDRRKEKYVTPEPGTYLKPAAYTLLEIINDVTDDPESFERPVDWVYKIFTPNQKKTLDTVIEFRGLRVFVRIYYPTRESLQGDQPVTLFIHGGGFSYGSVEEYDMMAGKLAKITGTILISVEYRLAPEHPFPAALNDCYAVLCWLQENATEIGGDTSRICLMGDSAGGNLATVLTLRCRDENRPQPACQVLIYPGVTFVDTLFDSRVYFGLCADKTYVIDDTFLRQVRLDYLGERKDVSDPYISPLEATFTPDLPPAMVITAECDPLRDEGRAYARKLKSAGVDVQHMEYSGMIHGFMNFHMIISDAVHAMKQIRDYLNQVLKKP